APGEGPASQLCGTLRAGDLARVESGAPEIRRRRSLEVLAVDTMPRFGARRRIALSPAPSLEVPAMMTKILSIVAGITTASLPAQCLFTSVTTQSIGPSCNFGSTGFCAIPSVPSTLTTTLDTVN